MIISNILNKIRKIFKPKDDSDYVVEFVLGKLTYVSKRSLK